MNDFKYAFRQLLKNPGFTIVVIVTLGLAIGANTAIFSFFNGILLRDLPYSDPATLAIVQQKTLNFENASFSPPEYLELKQQARTLEDLAAFSLEICTMTEQGKDPEIQFGTITTDNFFSVMGGRPQIGRTYGPSDRREGSGRLMLISDEMWTTKFKRDPKVVGQTVTMNGVSATIIGVMPPQFQYPRWAHFWINPHSLAPEQRVSEPVDMTNRNFTMLATIARLKPGVPTAEVEKDLTELVRAMPNQIADSQRTILLRPMREETIGSVRTALGVLLACVGVVLLIACLNVANLFLARATARQREIAVRLSLGASRLRIARQLLTESLMLALLGGVVGVVVGYWGSKLLLAIAPGDVPRLSEVGLDWRVLMFSIAVTVLTGIAFGLAPAWHTVTPDLAGSMKEGERSMSAGGARGRLRSALVIGEVALSMVLLVAAGLLLRSLWQMQSVDLGYRPEQVSVMRVAFAGPNYSEEARQLAFYRRVLEDVQAISSFDAVGLSFDLPGESWMQGVFKVAGQTLASPDDAPHCDYHAISPGFFDALSVQVLQGRDLTRADDENGPPVVIVNKKLADDFFPNGTAIGKHIHPWIDAPPIEIIGVVNDVRHDGPEKPTKYQLYVPFPRNNPGSFHFIVRSRMPLNSVADIVKGIVAKVDPTLAVSYQQTMGERGDLPAATRRFPLQLIGIFAGLALVLAAIGIYAVMAYSVSKRTREIGIRMALGARRTQVMQMILRAGMRIVMIGLVIGLAGALAATRFMRSMLFEISPFDPITFGAIMVILGLVALIACLLPARRATRIDPMVALRTE